MNRATIAKLSLAVLLLGVAAFMVIAVLRRGDGVSEQTFFYDLSEKKLFAVSREALPPIRGLNDAEEDAVRAVVICADGKKERRIAYLEKYALEYKQQIEQVRAGKAEPLSRGSRDAYRLVKPVDGTNWFPLSSPEGKAILTNWNVPGPDGTFPVVCSP